MTEKLSTLIRRGAVRHPELTSEISYRPDLRRNAFAQVYEGEIHTDPIGAAWCELHPGKTPIGLLDHEVDWAVMDATNTRCIILREASEDGVKVYLPGDCYTFGHAPVGYWITRWWRDGMTREAIATQLESLGL